MSRLSKKAAADIAELGNEEAKHIPFEPIPRFDMILSTGSTLLDLAISGGRVHGGGLPGGILVEIYGPSGRGKTAVAVEIGADAQAKGGTVRFNDPEGRLDQEYASFYGLQLDKKNYAMADTVEELLDDLIAWFKQDLAKDRIHVYICDSLAALSTKAEMEEGDKAGMLRAKWLSQMMRRIARLVSNKNRIVIFTNQVRQKPSIGGFGGPSEVTPGGEAVKFYASVRMRVGSPAQNGYITMIKKIRGVEEERKVGINSLVYISKNSCDNPYREAIVSIVFNYGLDNTRANLEFGKRFAEAVEGEDGGKKVRAYVIKDFTTIRLPNAIQHIETNDLEGYLREETITLWKEIEAHFSTQRKPKVRHFIE
jgi:recombination protein RecA